MQSSSHAPQSCRTTLSRELLTLSESSPSYSMRPSFLNLFRKKFTRDRVVPIISASVACDTCGTTRIGFVLFAVARQQEQRTRQTLLGIEQLIDHVFLDADVARQHVPDEPIGHGVLPVEQNCRRLPRARRQCVAVLPPHT